MERSSAGLAADQLLDIAEGELGVLVRKAPRDLGFVHRMIQEQLAAEHAANRLAPADQRALLERHVGHPQWREVLLGIMWRLQRPALRAKSTDQAGQVIVSCLQSAENNLRASPACL